jgi:flagellar protein FlbT
MNTGVWRCALPLLIDLKPGEKVIINGAVIENAGTNTKLRIHNEANILRQKEILTGEEATTPASRVYFCLQNAYIFTDKRDHYIKLFEHYLVEYLAACPSALDIGHEVRGEVDSGRYYKALKASRKLLKHVGSVIDALQKSAEKLDRAVSEGEG